MFLHLIFIFCCKVASCSDSGLKLDLPESLSSSVQKIDFELVQRNAMTAKLKMEMNTEGQMEKHQIVLISYFVRYC